MGIKSIAFGVFHFICCILGPALGLVFLKIVNQGTCDKTDVELRILASSPPVVVCINFGILVFVFALAIHEQAVRTLRNSRARGDLSLYWFFCLVGLGSTFTACVYAAVYYPWPFLLLGAPLYPLLLLDDLLSQANPVPTLVRVLCAVINGGILISSVHFYIMLGCHRPLYILGFALFSNCIPWFLSFAARFWRPCTQLPLSSQDLTNPIYGDLTYPIYVA